MSRWEKRTTPTGFLQFRESGDGWKGRWHFQIYSFSGEVSGQDGTCHVYAVDGHRKCSIDAKDRVLIEGRRYGRRNWSH